MLSNILNNSNNFKNIKHFHLKGVNGFTYDLIPI